MWGRVPEAGASKVGAAFDANHTRLNTKARGEPGGEILGVFSDHYEHLLLLKKWRKRTNYKWPSPVLLLLVATSTECFRGASCYDCPVLKIMTRSFCHSISSNEPQTWLLRNCKTLQELSLLTLGILSQADSEKIRSPFIVRDDSSAATSPSRVTPRWQRRITLNRW